MREKAMDAPGMRAANLSHVRRLRKKKEAALPCNWQRISMKGSRPKQCDAFVLITTSPMLGELRLHLSDATQKIVRNCVVGDFTRYEGADLEARVNQALQLPG
jgi:protein required for attachment to host cells